MTIGAATVRYQELVGTIENRLGETIGTDKYVQDWSISRAGEPLVTTTRVTTRRNGIRIVDHEFQEVLDEARERNTLGRGLTRRSEVRGEHEVAHLSFTVRRPGSERLVRAISHGIPLALMGVSAFFTAYVLTNNR